MHEGIPTRRIRAVLMRVTGLFGKERRDRELAEELESHLQMHIEDNLRSGMTPQEARRAAAIKLGGVEAAKEAYRDRRGFPLLEAFIQDVRFGLRVLRKSPGFTAIAVLTLALGIGANTAMFSVVNGFLRPLPVTAPEQITVLAARSKDDSLGSYTFSYPAFVDLRKQADAFSDLFAYKTGTGGLSVGGKAGQFLFSYVTGTYFSTLAVKPAAGRLFVAGEGETPRAERVLVLGYSYWHKRFGGRPDAIGTQVLVNGNPATIVGVAPKDFHGLNSFLDMDGYLPLGMLSLEQNSAGFWTDRSQRELTVLGRLKPGVSVIQAQSLLSVVAARLTEQHPLTDRGFTVRVLPERLSRPIPLPEVADAVPLLIGLFLVLAGLVLLLACMNVTNILLVRGLARQRELAVRVALGGGRGRLIFQMLTESLLLAILGGTAGVIVGVWAGQLIGSIDLATNLPTRLDFSFDWKVFTYAVAAAAFTAIVVGIWPAFSAARASVSALLREGGRNHSGGAHRYRVRDVLVAAQVAGSLMLLIVAGLFVRSLEHAQRMQLGFDPDHVLNVTLDPHLAGYDEPRTKRFYRELETRVRALPGVQSASQAYSVPMGTYNDGDQVYVEDRPLSPGQQPPLILYNRIGPAYFEAMRVPLLRGRVFNKSDNDKAPRVAIVNQTMAAMLWPNQDPLGKRFRSAGGPMLEVVGVAGNGKYTFIVEDALPYFYVPLEQNFSSMRVLHLRASVTPESLIAPLQLEIQSLDSGLPISDLRTMRQSLVGMDGFFIFRFGAYLAGAMGILGLILAVVGVYGVLSFAANQRTREIGIRMALGAKPRDVLSLVLRQGTVIVGIGLITGILAALAAARMVGTFLMVSGRDPATYVAVTAALALVALTACYIPARRAMRVDPTRALRGE